MFRLSLFALIYLICHIQVQILYCINNLQSQEDGAIMTE